MSKYDDEIGFWRGLNERQEWSRDTDGRALKHLAVKADHFKGKRVLEIGPGPLYWTLDFEGATVVGLEPLADEYRALGYPMDAMEYVVGFAEDMPFEDDSFDAVISWNAIDHVDDFEKSIAEVERVCKPDGIIRIECHYHEAWTCEPMVLNDKRVRAAFKNKAVKKLIERPYGDTFFPGHPESPSYTGTVALWSNDPTLDL